MRLGVACGIVVADELLVIDLVELPAPITACATLFRVCFTTEGRTVTDWVIARSIEREYEDSGVVAAPMLREIERTKLMLGVCADEITRAMDRATVAAPDAVAFMAAEIEKAARVVCKVVEFALSVRAKILLISDDGEVDAPIRRTTLRINVETGAVEATKYLVIVRMV